MQPRVISAIGLVAFVGLVGFTPVSSGQGDEAPPKGRIAAQGSEASFEQLKQQVLQRCQDAGEADVMDFAAAMFGLCRDASVGQEELLQSLVQNQNARVLRIHALQQRISLLADELSELARQHTEVDSQVREQRLAFANGGPAPSEELLDKLEAIEVQIASKKAAQRPLMKQHYELPQLAKVRLEVAALQEKLARAAAERTRWTEEMDKAQERRDAALKAPKMVPLERLVASMKLEKPACNVSKHWLARSAGKFNLFLIQMADGQVMGGALQPEPVQVYEVLGLVHGRNLSLKLVNKHDTEDVLTFTAIAQVDTKTGATERLVGTVKSASGSTPDREWEFE